MNKEIKVDVVSAEAEIFSGVAEFVVLPGESGDLGIYPNHAPLITTIKAGSVRIKGKNTDDENHIFVAGGILEVQPSVITVLADTAIRAEDLDEAKALDARRKAEDALKIAADKKEKATVEAELAMLTAQLAMIRRQKR